MPVDKSNSHTPNHISAGERLKSVVFSFILLLYGSLGLVEDDIYLPGKRGPGLHFHGVPVIILFVCFLFISANLISVVIDHYDKRNNETNYHRFARFTRIMGWALFFIAMLSDIFVYHLSHR